MGAFADTMIYQALLRIYQALLQICRALLQKYRARLQMYGALSRTYKALLLTYRDVLGLKVVQQLCLTFAFLLIFVLLVISENFQLVGAAVAEHVIVAKPALHLGVCLCIRILLSFGFSLGLYIGLFWRIHRSLFAYILVSLGVYV